MGEAFKFLSVQASARNVALYLQTSPGELRIKGDPVQLQQVILNLVVNSMDAMAAIPYGRTVIGRTELNGGSSVEISISEFRARHPAGQAEPGVRSVLHHQGSGHGDRAFHRAHHHSRPQGTNLGREPERRRRGVPFHVCRWPHRRGSLPGRVHVVDDDESFRTAIERRLKLAGYQVATYPSAQQLLDRLPDENEPGCILLDVQIPGLSGPELQGRLNELGSDVADRFPDRTCRYADRPCGPSRPARKIS